MSGYKPKDRAGHMPATIAEREASNRLAVLTLCERLFTVEEYAQLCADMGNGKVEIRLYDDGVVLMRKF